MVSFWLKKKNKKKKKQKKKTKQNKKKKTMRMINIEHSLGTLRLFKNEKIL